MTRSTDTLAAVASPPFDAVDAAEAAEQFIEAVEAFENGGPDTEAECLRLGSKLGLNLQGIKAQWLDARRLKRQDASRHKAAMPPSPSVDSWGRDRLNAFAAKQAQDDAEQQARIQKALALAKAKAASLNGSSTIHSLRSQSTPTTAPAVEPAVAPKIVPDGPKPPPPSLVLNPSSPLDSAREFVQRECRGPDGKSNLYHWQGQFYQWNGVYYRLLDVDVLEGQVLAFLDGAMKYAGGNAGLVRFQPGSRH